MSEFLWNRPVFIIGNQRSGTSLLRLMLHSHPEICIPPESHFFLWLEEKYGKWNNVDLEVYLEDLYNSKKFETWNLNRKELKNYLSRFSIISYAHLNSLVYYFYSLKDNKKPRYWGDKNGLWVDQLDKIKFYYPEAYIVHLIRDGRDVACSYKEINLKNVTTRYAPHLPNEIAEIAAVWDSNNIAIEGVLSTFLEHQVVQIKYEELLISPESILQKVLSPLGLETTKAQLEYYLQDSKDIEPEEFFKWKEKLVQPPDLSNIGKYQKILSESEINTFNTIAKHSMSKYNYL